MNAPASLRDAPVLPRSEGGAGTEAAAPRAGVITLAIHDKAALYAAYMPFVNGGGLFIPTERAAQIGDELYAIVSLLDDGTRIPIPGRVCWVTPAGVPGRPQGVGIQFLPTEAGTMARNRIENLIGAAMKSQRPTHTL